MTKMKVGLVGCGNIGADLCIALQKDDIPAEIVALTDIENANAERLQRSFRLNARICSLEANVAAVDFVVECADPEVVASVIEAAIKHGRDCLIMSVGGLMADPELMERAQSHRVHIRVPSGALCGLDGVRAAKEGGLHGVTLTTRKPPKGLVGAPYLVENQIDVERLELAKVVFEGTALEAVKAFPKNVNVAAALSLAGIGPRDTKVRVIADPQATLNSHEIVAEGAFGKLTTITENLPSPRNVKSSYLASLSARAELRAAAQAFVNRN
ncbi:MAG: aspartate dehydrogenase [Candidatus Hydrogenedentes bacterium]|nr:aspartate dehydrogenase [Candidatus Hydrogenedentota bacterium]